MRAPDFQILMEMGTEIKCVTFLMSDVYWNSLFNVYFHDFLDLLKFRKTIH